jgi:hypothetical protein
MPRDKEEGKRKRVNGLLLVDFVSTAMFLFVPFQSFSRSRKVKIYSACIKTYPAAKVPTGYSFSM